MIRTAEEKPESKLIRMFYVKGIEQDLQENCHYPLALYCLQQYARREPAVNAAWSIEVRTLDFEWQHEQVLYELFRDGAAAVGFSCYLWNYQKTFRIAEKLKLVRPDIPVIVGGPQVADAASTLREHPYVDYVIPGEGEQPFTQLLGALARGAMPNVLSRIGGLAFRNGQEIVLTPPGEVVPLADMPEIYEASAAEHLCGTVILETSRGCPYGCKFCFWGDTTMRYYPLERVERDLQFILRQPAVTGLFLIDAELDIDKQRARDVLRAVQRYNVRNIPVSGFLAFARWDEELMQLCQQTRFRLGIGIQSFSDQTLKTAGRNFLRREKAQQILRNLEPYYSKPDIQLQFIVGLPGDTYESIRANLAWCLEHGYLRLGVNRLFVLPGTQFYKSPDAFGLVRDPGGYHATYGTNTLPYGDILRAEMLLSGFRVFAHYFERVPTEFWRARGHEPIEVCARIGQALADQGMCFLGRQENEAPEFAARSAAPRSGREVLCRLLPALVAADDVVRLQDLVRYQFELEHCHSRLVTRSAPEEHHWRSEQLWRGPSFAIHPVEFGCDISRFVGDPAMPLEKVPLGSRRGYFVLKEPTGQVAFIGDVRREGVSLVEPLLRQLAYEELLMNMGIPAQAAQDAFATAPDLRNLYSHLRSIVCNPGRLATPEAQKDGNGQCGLDAQYSAQPSGAH